MMDLIACGAPLDSSFQKNKLELVNKGSLGRRRKPSRSNLKLLLSSSNSAPQTPVSTPQTPSSTPQTPNSASSLLSVPVSTTCGRKQPVNGSVYKERLSPQNFKPLPRTESSLPRTTSESKLVAEAQQFSIEAKLKRKKSDVGRSAVLIQTWERRTRNDSLPKRQQTLKNRFQNKENIGDPATMPDSYVCQKHSTNSLNGEPLKNGGLASKVRAAYSDDTMVYRISENGVCYDKQVQVNGNEWNGNSDEPEWISLSRKLRAKFVEGHIEHNSADSYRHEEPDGVKQQVAKLIPPPQQTKQPLSEAPHRYDMKKKVVDSMNLPANPTDEPPWIHLSRKLCTKFIEEHIEYPSMTPDQPGEEMNTTEPKGDLRIIEKVGKPKCRKSKLRKESEPEWVSLSRKLRAKFIESHIDDPETISLDNQLNASDPEENSSESLSDTSQEVDTPKAYKATKESTFEDFSSETKSPLDTPRAFVKRIIPAPHEKQAEEDKINSIAEDDCSWEYQAIEFEPEDSGTFLEHENFEDPFPRSVKNGHGTLSINVPSDTHNKKDPTPNNASRFTSFAETVNAQMFSNAECYNNDVIFSSWANGNEIHSPDNTNSNKNGITVQFVSRREKEAQREEKSTQRRTSESSEKRNNSSFFNLTTWEEAHYKPVDNRAERICSPSSNICLMKEWKSLEDICDHTMKSSPQETKNAAGECQRPEMQMKENRIYNSVDVLDKLECQISTQNGFNYKNLHGDRLEKREISERNNNKIQQAKSIAKQLSVNGISVDADNFAKCKSNLAKRETNIYSKDNDLELSKSQTKRCEEDYEVFSGDSEHASCKNNSNREESKYERKTEISCCDSSEANITKQETSKTRINSHPGINSHTYEENIFNNNAGHENGASLKLDSFDFLDENSGGYESHESDLSIDSDSNRHRKKALKNCRENEDKQLNQYGEKSLNMSDDSKQFQVEKNEKISKNSSESNEALTKKNHKCNGVIPNSKEAITNKSSRASDFKKEEKITNNSYQDLQKSEKRISKSETNNSTNEYANINPSYISSEAKHNGVQSPFETNNKSKTSQSISYSGIADEEPEENTKRSRQRRNTFNTLHNELDISSSVLNTVEVTENNQIAHKLLPNNNTSRTKSKSCQDISKVVSEDFFAYPAEPKREINHRGTGSYNNNFELQNTSIIKFQEFESVADIPLCAKLVSKQNGKRSTPSISSSSNRNPSPCSESSHVYEDMFKETTSCPSDSETSSWTVMKTNNSYYVNDRSSSMNDLDYSDSCSMSVKCDYASSSEQSTLQSRRSSVNSSSFYVNLRDYDSHMLEPSLSRKRKDHKKVTKNGNTTKLPNSNPPTPESLRHLFTSPLNSIYSPPNRASRLINKLPHEPEYHYYSTAAATSSAFKPGFDPTPPKPKKTERSSSIKIKDIAHGIILTFKRFQNHSKSSHVSPTHYVDVSHLADLGSKTNSSDCSKSRSKKEQKESSRKHEEKRRWAFSSENLKTDSDSGCQLTSSDVHRAKARRSSSDLVGKKPSVDITYTDALLKNGVSDKKKSKKNSNTKEKGKKSRSKSVEPRAVPTVTRKVQQMADGTLYLVTTVSGDTALPGVYSDSPDTSSELSSHRPVKMTGESNC